MSLGLGIFAFVLVCVIGLQFMLNKEVIPLDLESSKEGFSSSAMSVASPTRAADCNCLPGYIASNSGGEYDGNIYLAPSGALCYVPNGTTDTYIIDWLSGDTCNLIKSYSGNSYSEYISYNTDYVSKFPPLPNTFMQSNLKGILTCDVVKKTGGKNYFCQNLGDPTKTRSCY